MDFEKAYKENKNVWGKKPNLLLKKIWRKLDKGTDFLDLGAGQGRDTLFMLTKGFFVTAVEQSEEALATIKEIAKKKKLENLKLLCESLETFDIAANFFSCINLYNVFHFIKKDKTLEIINKIKQGVAKEGFIIISAFSIKDASFAREERKQNGYFNSDELKKLFADFDLVYYEEEIYKDKGHPGKEESHEHHMVQLIAKRI